MGPTSIEDIGTTEPSEGKYYNLQGLPVDPALCKGEILISNGKKVLIK